MDHPYKENENDKSGAPRYGAADFGGIDDFVDRAVQLGSRVGSKVLGSIADALQAVTDPPAETDFARCRKRMSRRLEDGQGGFMALGVMGWLFGGSFLIAFIVMAALFSAAAGGYADLVPYKTVFSILAAVFGPVGIGFGALGWFGVHKANWYGRLRRYLKVLRGWTAALNEIARDAVTSPGKVRRDLQMAVAAGRLGAAYYDAGTDTFYLDESHYRPAAPQPAADAAAEAEPTEAEKFAQQGADFLAYLRACKGRLTPDADAELDTMQRTCGAILAFIRNHPDHLPAVRRLAEYYLPTTRRLLDTALGLGDSDAANAQVIRRDITGILHTLNTAFARLYDTLLQDVSLDVSVEIDTLEAMLSQDGLTHGFAADFKPQQE